jgi:hypothetical protein
MKMRMALGMVLLAVAGCGTADPGTGPMAMTAKLSGTWFSGGSDMAKGFGGAPFNFVSLAATFNDDGSYTVKATDSGQKAIDFAGTWVLTPSEVPGISYIEQNQSVPQNVVSKGMCKIEEGGRMTFEIIQVQPDVGALPPTAMAGFGSTTVKGKATDAWIQKYSKQ